MKKLLLSLLGVLLSGILIGYVVSWFLQQSQENTQEVRIVIKEELPARDVQLYFINPAGDFLVPETQEIPGCDDDRDCIRSLIGRLIQGSQAGHLPVLPKETKILAVEVENDLVRVDFSRQLVDFHPGGSLSELLSIYSLANSLSENFPYLRQVQILIAGETRQTLKGHARIDQPVYADFVYSQPPLGRSVAEQNNAPGLSIEQLIESAESRDAH